MIRVIDKTLNMLACVIPLVYFTGISIYSYLPEIFGTGEVFNEVFYWCNENFFFASMMFLFSKFVISIKVKIIIIGVSIFMFLKGVFQVLMTLGVQLSDDVWILFAPSYILLVLIVYKYVSRKIF
jgi:hypothetical protein